MPRAAHLLLALLPGLACKDDVVPSLDTDGSSTDASTSSSTTQLEPTSLDESTGSSSESSTTGPMPCMGNEDCPDAAAPFCEPASGECVACDAFGAEADAACAGLDPMTPLCVNGTCVACTPENPVVCDDQLLLCDAGTNTCIQCTEHDQCASGACELAVGLCFPEDLVVHVDGDGGQDYMTIAAAVTAVDDGTHGVIVVHELDGSGSYQTAGGLLIGGGKAIALLAAPGEAPIIQGTGMGNPGLHVTGAGTILYMDGLTASLSPGVGLRADGAFAWVDRSRIVQNTGGGIVAQNAAELTLRNCFVGGNGSGLAGSFGIDVNGANLQVLYSTVARNDEAAIDSIRCMAGMVEVRNSIVVGRDANSIDCPGISIVNSALDEDVGGNTNVGPADVNWFVNATSDFHLTPMGATVFADIAQWQTGDPTTDIDGQLRPTVEGTADFAGADLVP